MIRFFLSLNVTIFLVFTYNFCSGQDFQPVLLLDSESKDGVPFAHIFDPSNLQIGTSSNENGYLRVEYLEHAKDSLCISHLAYESRKIPLTQMLNADTIFLKPLSNKLQEITVRAFSVDEIVSKTIKALPINHDLRQRNFMFYCREITYQLPRKLISFHEYAGEIVFKRNQSMAFYVGASRRVDQTVNESSKWMTSLFKMNSDNPLRWTNPCLKRRKKKKYEYSLKRYVVIAGRDCFEVEYQAKEPGKTYHRSGTLYIDKETYGLMGITIEDSEGKVINRVDFNYLNGKHVPLRSFDHHTGREEGTDLFVLYTPQVKSSVPKSEFNKAISAHERETYQELSADGIDKFCASWNCTLAPNWVLEQLRE